MDEDVKVIPRTYEDRVKEMEENIMKIKMLNESLSKDIIKQKVENEEKKNDMIILQSALNVLEKKQKFKSEPKNSNLELNAKWIDNREKMTTKELNELFKERSAQLSSTESCLKNAKDILERLKQLENSNTDNKSPFEIEEIEQDDIKDLEEEKEAIEKKCNKMVKMLFDAKINWAEEYNNAVAYKQSLSKTHTDGTWKLKQLTRDYDDVKKEYEHLNKERAEYIAKNNHKE